MDFKIVKAFFKPNPDPKTLGLEFEAVPKKGREVRESAGDPNVQSEKDDRGFIRNQSEL